MSLGVSQNLADALSAVERDKSCKKKNNGDHLWGDWKRWHKKQYKKYPSKPATGGTYFIRIRVCKDCGAREQDHFYPHDGAKNPEEYNYWDDC